MMASNNLISCICDAIINNDISGIVDLYAKNSSWQQFNPFCSHETDSGCTILLHLACHYGRLEIIRFFCDSQYCNVNCQDAKQRNALHHLITHRYNYSSNDERVNTVKFLIEKGCNIYARDTHGNTPIHMAVYYHDLQVLRVLVENKSSGKVVTDRKGNTPLHVACIAGLSKHSRNELISLLLNFCPGFLYKRNKKGCTPLFLACCANHSFFLEKLTPYYSYNLQQRSYDYNTLLHVAVQANKLCNVKWLMSQFDSSWFEYSVNNKGQTPLHLVRSTECIKALLDGGFNVNIQDSCGNTLLHTILMNKLYGLTMHEQLQLVQCLFQFKECDLNIPNEKHLTPLHLAVKYGLCEIVELFLLSNKCQIMMPDKEGNSILHMAVELNNLSVIQLLLRHERVDTTCTDYKLETPLHIAAIASQKDVLCCFQDYTSNFNQDGRNPLHLLVCYRDLDTLKHVVSNAKPDLTIPTRDGDTILHLASKHGKVETLSFIVGLKVLDINCTNFSLDSCLSVAVKESQIDAVKWLLKQRGCDVHHLNIHGLSPLMTALYDRSLDILRVIESAGITDISSIHTRNHDTCLHLAAQNNDIPMLKYSLKLIDVNSTNSNLETPFFTAVKYSHLQVVKILGDIDGCNVNARNLSDGNSPMHVAACQESTEVLQTLLGFRCDLELKNYEGLMPLHAAVKSNSSPSIDILLSSPLCDKFACTSNGNNILHIAAIYDVRSIFKHEELKGAMINSQNYCLDTPLHIAVRLSRLELVKLFLEFPDVDMNILNQDCLTFSHLSILQGNKDIVSLCAKAESSRCSDIQKTALYLAAKEGKAEIFDYLLNLKLLNANQKSDDGKAPLHVAISGGFVDIVEMIIKTKKCNVTLRDDNGNTPLHLACKLDANDQASVQITKLLLRTGRVTPQCVNKEGKSPAELAKDNYGILHQLSDFFAKTHTPLEYYMKIFVMGNQEVGKSSLIQAICTEAKPTFWSRSKDVDRISQRTAGIELRTFISKHFGHAMFYELAGHPEFYAPNAAILQNMVDQSPPVFIIVVSLKNIDQKILKDVRYWWSFISHQCKNRQLKLGTCSPSQTILALSYLDVYKKQSRCNIEEFQAWLLRELDKEFPAPNFEFGEKISTLDCRKIASKGLTQLQCLLISSCRTSRIECDVNFNCHYLIAFLRDNFVGHHAIQLKDVEEKLCSHSDSFITRDLEELIKLLSTLHDRDLILLLKNEEIYSESWIILQREVLLSKVTGSVFSSEKFPQHCFNLADSTGVVPLSNFKKYFGEYDPLMLANFFSHLEFCSLIDPKAKILIKQQYPLVAEEKYYFFPGLIRDSYPPEADVWKSPLPESYMKWGWYYEADRFELMPRFVHVLILRVAFTFALDVVENSESPALNRRCSIWTNGIAWLKDGLQVVVEVGVSKNWVSVVINCESNIPELRVHCTQLLSELTGVIRETREEFCASLSMKEYFVSPECVGYPIKLESDVKSLILYELTDAVKSILSGTGIVTDKYGRHSIQLSQLVAFEPLLYCGQTLISSILSSSSLSNEKVKNDMIYDSQLNPEQVKLIDAFFHFFHRKNGINCSPAMGSDIPESFSKFIKRYSILSSKLKSYLSQEDREQVAPLPLQCSNSGISNFQVNQESLRDVAVILVGRISHEWINIGVLIGVPMEKLKAIHCRVGLSAEVCCNEMLSFYFSHNLSSTWGTLIAAVRMFNTEAARELVSLCLRLYPTLRHFDSRDLLQEAAHLPSDKNYLPQVDIQNVFWHLISHASKWCQIGEKLRVPDGAIQAILQDYPRCCDRLREILHIVFTQVNDKCTWFTFANALENIHAETALELRAKGIIEIRASSSVSPACSGPCCLQFNEHHISVFCGDTAAGGNSNLIIKIGSKDIERVSFDEPQNSVTFYVKSSKESYSFTFDSTHEIHSIDRLLKEYYF